jgi:hypothetical protein
VDDEHPEECDASKRVEDFNALGDADGTGRGWRAVRFKSHLGVQSYHIQIKRQAVTRLILETAWDMPDQAERKEPLPAKESGSLIGVGILQK